MEFNQKLQELRKSKGLTQAELADNLYVSRTAVSKWESGRGYPSIESLKAIATFFSVTVDELFSSEQIIFLAEEDKRADKRRSRDTVCGLLDFSYFLLLLLPIFALRSSGEVYSAPIYSLVFSSNFICFAFYFVIIATVISGVYTIVMQNCSEGVVGRIKTELPFVLNILSIALFTLTLHPYVAFFAFSLFLIKLLLTFRLS